jgi:hypothetical protein
MAIIPVPNTYVNNVASGSGTTLVLPTLPVAISPGDLLLVGVSSDYDGTGDPAITISDDLIGTWFSALRNDYVGSLGRQVALADNQGADNGQPTVTITWATARANRRGYAHAFRNTKPDSPITFRAAQGFASTPVSSPVEHTTPWTQPQGNGILVAMASQTHVGRAGSDWKEIGNSFQTGSKNDMFEYRDRLEWDTYPVTVRDDGAGSSEIVLLAASYFGDSEALQWYQQSAARVLNVRGGGP